MALRIVEFRSVHIQIAIIHHIAVTTSLFAMEPLTLKPRQLDRVDIECWDDDEDLQGIDNLHFRNTSTTTIASTQASYHRDSISSRVSTRSDRDSNGGNDEDWQVLIPTDDEISTNNAIASAQSAGIPIPSNVPSSALLGGTIKRLGGRRLQKVLVDDWGEDLELSKVENGGLTLKKNDVRDFSDTLRQFSAEFVSSPSPSNLNFDMAFMDRMASDQKTKPSDDGLDRFREDDSFGDVPTIKVAKNRSPRKPINFDPPTAKSDKNIEDMEEDLEFPVDGELKLSARKEVPKTPALQLHDEFDIEWAEGSLGTRYGGTRRDGRSDPSSSISAFSPSNSSCLTAESEDEGLDGLVLPDGPIKFDEVLKNRLEKLSTETAEEKPVPKPEVKKVAQELIVPKEDFFSGLEIGDGDVFDSGKGSIHRHVKIKNARPTSPARRTAMTLTFTNKAQSGATKIPRLQENARTRSTLEPVFESGGPSSKYRRPQSRLGGHSSQSSVSNLPTPSTSSSYTAPPSTPSRRGLNNTSSRDTLRPEPMTNAANILRNKRSMPIMRPQRSPARSQQTQQRPPSRGDFSNRPVLLSRPKTPTERSGAESSLGITRKPPIPFLPAGTSHTQSHHISIKTSRTFQRPNSSDSNENIPLNRPISRLSNPHYRPTTPTSRKDYAPESLTREAASKRTLRPIRRRAFCEGIDGTELDGFDDLPTSASTESRFEKKPVSRGAPKSSQLRTKFGASQLNATSCDSPLLPTQLPQSSPVKQDMTPRFARDTNASRAREHRMGSVATTIHTAPSLPTVREGGPLNPVSSNWKAQIAAKGLASPSASRSKRGKAPLQKPRLIKPMGEGVNSAKTLKGMQWNPTAFRWEGNENALASFDAPSQAPHSPKQPPTSSLSKAAPALIANVGPVKGGVQVYGGMVFDPQRMCWLKMAPSHTSRHQSGASSTRSPETIEEDEDPFAGLDDLDDVKDKKSIAGAYYEEDVSVGMATKNSLDDEWLVGEEFDVGPEFIKRQRAEEEKWRRKVEGWVGQGIREPGSATGYEGDIWRWALRGKVEILLS